MTNAFKCDSCNEFNEGNPNRFKIQEYNAVGITGWSGGKSIARTELCDDCAASFVDAVSSYTRMVVER